jgi:hypothetical protein
MALSDNTNYGNPPGLGPLAPGGQASPYPISSEKDTPDKLSKAAESQVPSLRIVRDLEAGPGKVKDCAQTYLPQSPGESPANYRNRLQRSVLFNIFGHTVKGLTGFVFRKDPILGDDVPVQIRGDEQGKGGHAENIDLAGTHLHVFLRDLMQDAMVAGHAAILVEFPRVDRANYKAERDGEIRPYWIPIKKDNILSWRTTVENGRTILTQVVLKECNYVPDGRFAEKEETRYRVLYRENGVVGFDLLAITEDKKVVVVDQGAYPTQAEIPLAEIVTSGRKSIFDSEPPLLDLAFLNLAHYRQWSDYDTSIHKTCVPIWITIGEQIDPDNAGKTQVLGASTGLALPLGADAKYVSHDGAALGSCKASLDDLMTGMANIGMGMMSSEKRVAETEKSKEISKAGTDSQLAISARGLQDGTERALQFHANYLDKKPDGGSITINRDYNEMLMDAPVMQAYAALVAAGFPKEIAVRMLIAGGRLPEGTDPTTVALEWDAAAKAAEEVKRLEKERSEEGGLGVTLGGEVAKIISGEGRNTVS